MNTMQKYNVREDAELGVVDHVPFDYKCECPICGFTITRGTGENHFVCMNCGQRVYAPEIFLSEDDSTDDNDEYKRLLNYINEKDEVLYSKLDDIDARVNKILEILRKTT